MRPAIHTRQKLSRDPRRRLPHTHSTRETHLRNPHPTPLYLTLHNPIKKLKSHAP